MQPESSTSTTEDKASKAKDQAKKDLVQVHMRLLVEQRDYIKRLATNRTINPSGGIDELFSRGMVLFLAAEPYKEKGWEWLRPQATYIVVAGERMTNPGWCAAHYIVIDIEERGVKFTKKSIQAMVKSVAATIDAERGMQQLLFSAVDWMTTKLYPRHVYDIKHLPNRFQIEPQQLEQLAKAMAKL